MGLLSERRLRVASVDLDRAGVEWSTLKTNGLVMSRTLPLESDLFGLGGRFRGRRVPEVLSLHQSVPLLKHPHHRADFLPVRLGRVLLRVEAIEPRRHRREFAFDEFHEMRP